MGSSLGPVLANIILTKFEKLIASDLINDGTIKFYNRYQTLQYFHCFIKFYLFWGNLTFTVDTFHDGMIHFLDTTVSVNGTDING